MILIRVVNVILGDSDSSTIGIKCHSPSPQFSLSLSFEHHCTRKLKCLFTPIFTVKKTINNI